MIELEKPSVFNAKTLCFQVFVESAANDLRMKPEAFVNYALASTIDEQRALAPLSNANNAMMHVWAHGVTFELMRRVLEKKR